jgi:hypothetical protein
MRNILFSAAVCIVCTFLWIKGRNRARKYRREWNEKYNNKDKMF